MVRRAAGIAAKDTAHRLVGLLEISKRIFVHDHVSDEVLADLKATHVHPVPRRDMTVREAFNRVGADEWDALRTRFRQPAQQRASE